MSPILEFMANLTKDGQNILEILVQLEKTFGSEAMSRQNINGISQRKPRYGPLARTAHVVAAAVAILEEDRSCTTGQIIEMIGRTIARRVLHLNLNLNLNGGL